MLIKLVHLRHAFLPTESPPLVGTVSRDCCCDRKAFFADDCQVVEIVCGLAFFGFYLGGANLSALRIAYHTVFRIKQGPASQIPMSVSPCINVSLMNAVPTRK